MSVLILASASAIRAQLLRNAGYDFQVYPADIDEDILKKQISDPAKLAQTLSEEKSLIISKLYPKAYVIGADQTLSFQGQLLSKASTQAEAKATLKALRGHVHHLISGVSLARGGEILWSATDQASLTMRSFDEAYVEKYITALGDDCLKTVGGYYLEGLGSHLFDHIQGDYFTILGLPLLSLQKALRAYHIEGF